MARIAIVAWIERVFPSPTELLILPFTVLTVAFCGFSTPGARGQAGGERGRRNGGGYRKGEGISEGGKGGGGGGFTHIYRSGLILTPLDSVSRHSAPPPRESSKTILSTPRTDRTELFAGSCYFYVLVKT